MTDLPRLDTMLNPLGPDVGIDYLRREDDGYWWCELNLSDQYTQSNACGHGTTRYRGHA